MVKNTVKANKSRTINLKICLPGPLKQKKKYYFYCDIVETDFMITKKYNGFVKKFNEFHGVINI